MSPDTGKLPASLTTLLQAMVAKILGHRDRDRRTDHHPIPSWFLSASVCGFTSTVGTQFLRPKVDVAFNMVPPSQASCPACSRCPLKYLLTKQIAAEQCVAQLTKAVINEPNSSNRSHKTFLRKHQKVPITIAVHYRRDLWCG